MRRKLSKQWYSASVFLLLIGALAAWVTLSDNHSDFSEKYRGENLSRAVIGIGRQNTYAVYLQRYEETPDALENITISLKDYVQAQGVHVQIDNDGQPVLLTQEGSDITWKVEVPQEGMYRLNLEYLTLPSRGVDVERALYINGEVPFLGADKLLFSRMWTDAGAVRTDNQGNQIRPAQQEVFFWQTVDFKDPLGYETAPYRFYFSKGENTLRLVGTNEPMVLRSLTLGVPEKAPVYMQYYEAAKSTAGQPSGVLTDIPGEAAQLRSSPSLYARYDRSSPATVPSDLSRVVLNYIGGDSWRIPGQWIQWDIEVPEDGLYLITGHL